MDAVRGDIDTHAQPVDHRLMRAKPLKPVGGMSDSFTAIGDSMTMNSQDTERAAGQVSPSGATFAVSALLLTSAILTFLVGVFALLTHEVVAAGSGYEYTFQITGWGWVNVLTGVVVSAVALAVFLNPVRARVAAIVAACLAIMVSFQWMPYYPPGAIVLIALDVVAIWGVATWNTSRESA
jgi:hypothetical protein